jgi:hypothetical protein
MDKTLAELGVGTGRLSPLLRFELPRVIFGNWLDHRARNRDFLLQRRAVCLLQGQSADEVVAAHASLSLSESTCAPSSSRYFDLGLGPALRVSLVRLPKDTAEIASKYKSEQREKGEHLVFFETSLGGSKLEAEHGPKGLCLRAQPFVCVQKARLEGDIP